MWKEGVQTCGREGVMECRSEGVIFEIEPATHLI